MTKTINGSIKAQLFKIVYQQLVIILGLAVLVGLLQGVQKGLSVLSGGLAYWVPTLLFVWRVSRHAGARAAVRFVVTFFAGEFIKLFLSGVLFVMAVKYLSIDMLYGIAGLIGAIIAFWITSLISLSRQGAKI